MLRLKILSTSIRIFMQGRQWKKRDRLRDFSSSLKNVGFFTNLWEIDEKKGLTLFLAVISTLTFEKIASFGIKFFLRTQRAEAVFDKIISTINKTYPGLISMIHGFQKCIACIIS